MERAVLGALNASSAKLSKQTGYHSLARSLETMLDAGLWMTAGCNDSF